MNNKVLLMILDGWGNGRHDKADVISTVHPEYISAMTEKYPHAELRTDGENVGLPDGQMGNSEVGHLNIGAGRVVYQDLVKINRACRDNLRMICLKISLHAAVILKIWLRHCQSKG